MDATLTEEQLKLRQQVLMILFREFGNGKYQRSNLEQSQR